VLEAALRRIIEWADAYPVAIFPLPDEDYWKRADLTLRQCGMALDRITADAMRHCLSGVRNIAADALGP
jgi:hypothetical protein